MDEPAAKIFGNQDAFATSLIALGIDRFGIRGPTDAENHDCLNWTPETWKAEVRDEFGIELPQRNLDRIMGACALLARPDEFYTSAPSFTDITQAIAGDWFDSTVWHPPSTSECLWAVVEAYLLDPPEHKEGEDTKSGFSSEIIRYVNMIAREEGFHRLPALFVTFGLPIDESSPPENDYSSDPSLAAAANLGVETREADLSSWVSDRLTELSEQIQQLPLKSGRQQQVSKELRSFNSKPSR